MCTLYARGIRVRVILELGFLSGVKKKSNWTKFYFGSMIFNIDSNWINFKITSFDTGQNLITVLFSLKFTTDKTGHGARRTRFWVNSPWQLRISGPSRPRKFFGFLVNNRLQLYAFLSSFLHILNFLQKCISINLRFTPRFPKDQFLALYYSVLIL